MAILGLDAHSIFVIIHLVGLAVGAGGAFTSDAIFFNSIRDRKITETELRFMKLVSKLIWTGLAILVVSGIVLFSFNAERYLNSGKFLAKMTIVAIIIVNGTVFHFYHIPRIEKHVGKTLSKGFNGAWLFVSGAVSVISWLSALTLGALGRVPYSYFEIMGVYLVLVAIAISISLALKRMVL